MCASRGCKQTERGEDQGWGAKAAFVRPLSRLTPPPLSWAPLAPLPHFLQLKEIHLKSQETAKQLQRRYNALYQERVSGSYDPRGPWAWQAGAERSLAPCLQVEVERQYQQLCESWRLELEEKQKQFDEARAQIMQPKYGCWSSPPPWVLPFLSYPSLP